MWTSSGTEAVLLHTVSETFRLLLVSSGLSAECDKKSHPTEIQKSALRPRHAAEQHEGGCASEPSAAPSQRPSVSEIGVPTNRNFSGTMCTLLQIRQLHSRLGVNNYDMTAI